MKERLNTEPDKRHCWVGAPEVFALGHACEFVSEALGEVCYIVGSALERRDFRDVDVRMIFDDEKWIKLFGNHANGEVMAFWSLLCTAVSEYLSKRSGLKVDFQVQRRSMVKQSDWDKHRVPVGIYLSNIEPEWRKQS